MSTYMSCTSCAPSSRASELIVWVLLEGGSGASGANVESSVSITSTAQPLGASLRPRLRGRGDGGMRSDSNGTMLADGASVHAL